MLRLKDLNVNYILRAIARRICRLKLLSFNTYYMLRLRKKDILLVNASMNWNIDGVVHQNFGDDLNYFMLKRLTGKHIFNYPQVWNIIDNVRIIHP